MMSTILTFFIIPMITSIGTFVNNFFDSETIESKLIYETLDISESIKEKLEINEATHEKSKISDFQWVLISAGFIGF